MNRSPWVLGGLALALIAAAPTAQAKKKATAYKCPATPEDDAEAEALAGELFDQGEALSEKNKFQKALVQFLCSATIRDHVNTHFNIAQAARYMKHKRKLVQLLEHFVSENPDTNAAKELSKLIAIIQEQLDRRRRGR